MTPVYRASAMLAATIALVACSGGDGPVTRCAITDVIVSPASATLAVGATTQLGVTFSTSNCKDVPTKTWSSLTIGTATVSAGGLVTAVTPGSSIVTATVSSGKVSANGTALITVTPPPIATLDVQPSTSSVSVGLTTALSVVAKDAQGNTLSGRSITWTTLTPSVATVSSAGVVTGISVGVANISAAAEGKTALAIVNVTPAPVATVSVALNAPALIVGQTTQALATVRDAAGTSLSGRTVTWQSSNTATATVDAFGVVTSLAPGTSSISASSEGKSGAATLTVTVIPVASVTLAVGTGSMRVGDTQTASASARDVNGTLLTGRTITWASSNLSVATVSQTGVITALSVGTVAVSAASEGQFSSVAITITPGIATVDLTVPVATITAGQSTQATAVAKDGSGNTLAGVPITYASSNQSVATINSLGAITAVGAGTTTISATAGAVTRNVTLTVTAVVVAVGSVTVTPAIGSVLVGAGLQLTATPKDALGVALTGRTITWTSANNSIASVSSTGNVTGVSSGAVIITAAVEGRTATSTITVGLVPVATVVVSTPSASVSVGSTVQATAVLTDANGATVSRQVAWSSSNSAIATVNTNGLITAVSAGGVTITGSAEGKSGTKAITVLGTPTLSAVSAQLSNAADGRTNIESTVIINFSENIDASTVTASTVTLTKGGVAVAATRTTSGKVVTLTPTALLTEFNSTYSLLVTTGVKSAVGNSLPGAAGLDFTTVFWDENYYYRLINEARGASFSLDTYSDSYSCFMGPTDAYSGQFWYFVPISNSGYSTMQNAYGGAPKALEGAIAPGACFMVGNVPPLPTGMFWKATVDGSKYRLQNLNFGTARSLDAGTAGVNDPNMATTAATTRQYWTFVRLFRR